MGIYIYIVEFFSNIFFFKSPSYLTLRPTYLPTYVTVVISDSIY